MSYHRATGTTALFAPVLAFGVLGVIGIWYPQLFGNGLDMARDAFLGISSAGLLLTLFALKPLVTALCLGSGASGGLFTPTLATGAVLGGALGIAWNLAWPGTPSGAFAMVSAAAMIGASMQAPLSGLALVLELTHSGFGLMVPMMAATGIATLVAFHVDGYSIYSARLPGVHRGQRPRRASRQPGGPSAIVALEQQLGGTPLARLSGLARRNRPISMVSLAARPWPPDDEIRTNDPARAASPGVRTNRGVRSGGQSCAAVMITGTCTTGASVMPRATSTARRRTCRTGRMHGGAGAPGISRTTSKTSRTSWPGSAGSCRSCGSKVPKPGKADHGMSPGASTGRGALGSGGADSGPG